MYAAHSLESRSKIAECGYESVKHIQSAGELPALRLALALLSTNSADRGRASRSQPPGLDPHGIFRSQAALAQLVEHIIRNDGVRCSSHLSGTTSNCRSDTDA